MSVRLEALVVLYFIVFSDLGHPLVLYRSKTALTYSADECQMQVVIMFQYVSDAPCHPQVLHDQI